MKALLNTLNEHRLQLAIGFAIAIVAAFVMTQYESGFEHRYDETFREWLDSEAKAVKDDFDDLEREFREQKIKKADYDDARRKLDIAQRELQKIRAGAAGRWPGYDWLENLELRTYDSRFRWRGKRSPSDKYPIAIVAYDDATQDQVKVFPWPRELHAHVVDKLRAAGAKVICFDTRFDAYQGMKQVTDFKDIGTLQAAEPRSGDLMFAKDCKRAGNVIVTADILEEDESARVRGRQLGWREILRMRQRATSYLSVPYPDEKGDSWEKGYGISRRLRDSDGFVRGGFLCFQVTPPGVGANGKQRKPEYYASLAALAAGTFLGIEEEKLCADLWKGVFNGKRIPVLRRFYDPRQFYHGNAAFVNYLGPRKTFPTISYYQVLSDDPKVLLAENEQQMRAKLRQMFAGKIVFIGATSDLHHDSHPTPFSSQEELTPGVEIHATMAHTLLTGNFISAAPRMDNVLAIFITALVTVLLCVLMSKPIAGLATFIDKKLQFNLRGMKVRLYAPAWVTFYTLFGIVPPMILYLVFAFQLFARRAMWIVVVYPVVAAFITDIGVVTTMFLTEEVKRRKAQGRFEHLVSPAVLEEILKHPGEAEELPKPRRVEATLIFTDLQGFTTLSEQNTAEKVVEVLNEYISRMNAVIFNRGGTIDKYEGDAIMIEFGVPVPQPDHAVRAVLCAIDMQEACTKLRNEVGRPNGWPDLYMRVGINSGEVIAGLIGGGDRFDYTTIGDTVNLAARLEPLNKQTHSWILIGDRTYEYVKDLVVAEAVPGIQVKGKTQAVDVYAVHGTIESGRRDDVWGEGADKAPKAPTESHIGAAQKEPSPAAANEDSSPAEAGEPVGIESGT